MGVKSGEEMRQKGGGFYSIIPRVVSPDNTPGCLYVASSARLKTATEKAKLDIGGLFLLSR